MQLLEQFKVEDALGPLRDYGLFVLDLCVRCVSVPRLCLSPLDYA
jgi:hypothetical protein